MRGLLLVLALVGCASEPPSCPTPPVVARDCPGPVAVPAPLPRVHTQDQLAQFAIRLEIAREQERARGDAVP
jgi:hypothetical protein